MIARASIATDRLVLEPVAEAHDADLVDAVLASREELLPWMPWAAAPTASGQGCVTEAARALIEWAATAFPVSRVRLDAGVQNHRSLAVARRLGFVRSGPVSGGMEGGRGTFPADRHHYVITTPLRSGGLG